jgi:phosphoglycerate dehydrogenase-like enzyme
MLAAARRIPEGDASVRSGAFQQTTPNGFVLAGKTLGLIGLGRIGARMARYGTALGMNVLAWSQNLTDERAADAGARRVAKEALLAEADVVSLHLVLSPRTRGVLAAAELAAMKRGAILVNTSRAGLVDEAALVAALREGRLLAGLDVYEQEPLPAGHPLTTLRNAVLTPHLGYSTLDVYRVFYPQCIENALAFLDGAPLRVMASAG